MLAKAIEKIQDLANAKENCSVEEKILFWRKIYSSRRKSHSFHSTRD